MVTTPQIRVETEGDREAVFAVQREAFHNELEPRLVDALRDSGDAEISLVAEDAGVVVGHVMFSRLQAPMRALALAPVAVAPVRQRQGIGSALIRVGLSEAKRSGWDAVFVVGEPAYYQRFGFEAAVAKGFDSPYAGDFFMLMFLSAAQPTTGVIVYPKPFQAQPQPFAHP